MAARLTVSLLACLLGLALAIPAGAQTTKWLPVTAGELGMREHRGAPGADAVYLYREYYTDDQTYSGSHYYRIKVLTEEGRSHADIEIPMLNRFYEVYDIEARVVQPDGSVQEFRGRIYEKTIYKTRGLKFLAKTFTLPDVRVGSILEYRYRVRAARGLLLPPTWVLPQDLFTVRARFLFRPYPRWSLNYTMQGLPGGKPPQQSRNGDFELEVENIPAFEEEEYMPPGYLLKSHVDFFYSRDFRVDPSAFWKNFGAENYEHVEKFIGNSKDIAREAAALVAGAATPEEKLRRLYARAAAVRNLSYERARTEKEEQREKRKEITKAEDVLKHGYGYRWNINRFFVALARAAGFPADVVLVCERDTGVLHKNVPKSSQLDGEVAVVKLDGEERFFDPGSPFCPFSLLAWQKTDVEGLRLTKDGGVFVRTPAPLADHALLERKAALSLDESGTLRGAVTVVFAGYGAQRRRREAAEEDEVGRRTALEDEVKEWLPAGAKVTLEGVNSWEDYELPLEARFSIEITQLAASTGTRLLLPRAVFHANQKQPFQAAARKHPVYMAYPIREVDEVVVELPENVQVQGFPDARTEYPGFARYAIVARDKGRTVELERKLALDSYFFDTAFYSLLRDFFTRVRAGDEEPMVLQVRDADQD